MRAALVSGCMVFCTACSDDTTNDAPGDGTSSDDIPSMGSGGDVSSGGSMTNGGAGGGSAAGSSGTAAGGSSGSTSSGGGAAGAPAGGGSTSTGPDLSNAILHVTFDDAPVGPYTREAMDPEWLDIVWASIDRVEVIEGSDAYDGKSLRVSYPQGGVGPGEGGAQFQVQLPDVYDELYLMYWLRFEPGFDFVLGGKIPGLVGGAANTGGDQPTGTDGWSARMMWRTDGDAVQYVYHPDQPTQYGEDFDYDIGGQRQFVPGTWHQVEHRIVMNTPGVADGIVQAWFDGELALDRSDVRFRDTNAFAIDKLYFSTFFGGSGAEWAPTRDEYVYFDEFVISTTPIAH